MRRWLHPLLTLLAIVFLIEAWLWSRLEPIVEWIVARIPLRPVKAWIAGTIRKLSPAATLIVFVVPAIVLFPLKLLGLWLLANKLWIADSLCQAGRTCRHRVRLRDDAAEAVAAPVVSPDLRAGLDLAILGAPPGRSDHATDQDAAANAAPGPGRAVAAAAVAHPPPHARGARRSGLRLHIRCTACGAHSPSAMKPRPTRPSAPPR